jgi:hypothetical protein
VEPLKQPRRGYDLALRTADQARTDFAALCVDLELIMSQLGQVPRRKDLGWSRSRLFCAALPSLPA